MSSCGSADIDRHEGRGGAAEQTVRDRGGDGDEFRAPSLVVATGGLSIPKIGATSFGYDVARQFGVKIQPCRPALVPLVFDADDRRSYCDLAGVSAEVVASAEASGSARRCCLRIAASAGRRSCKFRRTGTAGEAIAL